MTVADILEMADDVLYECRNKNRVKYPAIFSEHQEGLQEAQIQRMCQLPVGYFRQYFLRSYKVKDNIIKILQKYIDKYKTMI